MIYSLSFNIERCISYLFLFPHETPDELHRLLERVAWIAAGVEDEGAQAHVGEEAAVRVDLVKGVQHRLHALKGEKIWCCHCY